MTREAVAALLQQGADANAQNEQGFTPFQLAAQHGLSDVCEVLLDYGTDVAAALKAAVGQGMDGLVTSIITRVAASPSPPRGWQDTLQTSLEAAVRSWQPPIVRQLMPLGSKLQHEGFNAINALFESCPDVPSNVHWDLTAAALDIFDMAVQAGVEAAPVNPHRAFMYSYAPPALPLLQALARLVRGSMHACVCRRMAFLVVPALPSTGRG